LVGAPETVEKSVDVDAQQSGTCATAPQWRGTRQGAHMPTKVKSTRSRTTAKAAPRRKPATPAKCLKKATSQNEASATKRRKTAAGPDTKQTQLITLLSASSGATLADMTSATGWQPHSVRGVISGVLRKKLGLRVDATVIDGTRRYRIVAA
jgi:Protein of unknown function (DUF3489)